MLLCEALKGNKYLQSLFLNSNNISSDGAYAVADLLMDEKNNLVEVHLAWNLICNTGLNSLLTCLAMSNTKLKFIDIAYNFMDISVMHALRLMLERNTTLKYLSVNDLHRFNERAIESLAASFASNQALKMVVFKQVTREFYEYLTETVNGYRKDPIEFRRDTKFIIQPQHLRNQQTDSETPAQKSYKRLIGS
jgi:Ran GTPase-activating protein (RanGAP) involved in mRNA processing and transport